MFLLDVLRETKPSLSASSTPSNWGDKRHLNDPSQLLSPSLALLKYTSLFKFWKPLFQDYGGLVFLQWIYKRKIREINDSYCHWSWSPQTDIHYFPPLLSLLASSCPYLPSLLVWFRACLLKYLGLLSLCPSSSTLLLLSIYYQIWAGSAKSCLRRSSGCWTYTAMLRLCKSSPTSSCRLGSVTPVTSSWPLSTLRSLKYEVAAIP